MVVAAATALVVLAALGDPAAATHEQTVGFTHLVPGSGDEVSSGQTITVYATGVQPVNPNSYFVVVAGTHYYGPDPQGNPTDIPCYLNRIEESAERGPVERARSFPRREEAASAARVLAVEPRR
ncbi:MAG: hypothetical protein ACRD2W_04255 [Acidimicrobiales bacterium]